MTPCINLPDFVHTFHQQVFQKGVVTVYESKYSKRKRIYRCVLLCLLLIVFGAISCRYYTAAAKKIPTKLILYKNRTESFNLGFPFYAKLSSDDAKAVSFQNDVKSTNHARSGRKYRQLATILEATKQVCLCLVLSPAVL